MVSASAAAAASDLEKTSGSEGACSLKGFDEGLFRIFLCVKHCKCRSVLSLSSFSVFDCNQLMNLLVTWLSCLLVTWLSCPGLEVFGHIIHAYISEYFWHFWLAIDFSRWLCWNRSLWSFDGFQGVNSINWISSFKLSKFKVVERYNAAFRFLYLYTVHLCMFLWTFRQGRFLDGYVFSMCFLKPRHCLERGRGQFLRNPSDIELFQF